MENRFKTLALFVLVCVMQVHANEPIIGIDVMMSGKTAPFQPVAAKIAVKNIGGKVIEITDRPTAEGTEILLQNAATKEIEYEGVIAVSREQLERFEAPILLPPGESVDYDAVLTCRWVAGKPVIGMFEHAGEFNIRFRISIVYRDGNKRKLHQVESEWRKLEVVQPSESDQEPLNALLKMEHRGWIFENQDSTMLGSAEEQRKWETFLVEFVTDHPKSYWTPHAHVALAYLYEARALDWQNRPTPEMKARWMTKAKQSLRRVEGSSENMSAGDVRIMLLNRDLAKVQPKPAATAPKPALDNPMDALQRELAAKRYDLRAVSRNRSPWAMEMKHKMLEFHDLWAQGKMTKAEVAQREAEVFEEYVLKHDAPLSLAEWKRRTENYAKEDEALQAQKARQRAIQMKNAPENARILKEAIEKHRREQEKNPK